MLVIFINKYFLGTLYRKKEIQVVPLKLDSPSPMHYTRCFMVYSSTSQLSVHLFVNLFIDLVGTKAWAGYSEGYKDMWYIVPCQLIVECGK